jgi:hypothetical protein
MKHRLGTVLFVLVAASATLVSGAAANHGRHHRHAVHAVRVARQARAHVQHYSFSGTLLATPGASAASVSLQVTAGNGPALRAMLGSAQNEVFDTSGSEVLLWSQGVPHVGSTADLQAGQYLTVNVRAPFGASLTQIESTPAGIVSEHAAPGASLPLFLFVGTVSGPQSGGKVMLNVNRGNHNALRLLVGQSTSQSFSYDAGTIFLLWQGRVPTVTDPSRLIAGDRITVRIRAPHASTLAQVEATPAKHVGDHEPGM